MNSTRRNDASSADRIIIDEVGNAFAVVGAFRLKSAFQTIFRRNGSLLVPVCVSPSSVIQQKGVTLPPSTLLELPPELGSAVAELAPRLAVLNLLNLFADDSEMELQIAARDGAGAEQVAQILRDADFAGVPFERLVVDMSEIGSAEDLSAMLDAVALTGVCVSVEMGRYFEVEEASLGRRCCRVVRLPARLFRRIMSEPILRNLLPPLVKSLQRRRVIVQVEGIDEAESLRIAIAIGADRLQGDLLAKAALAGVAFDELPLSIPALIGTRDNVISFSA